MDSDKWDKIKQRWIRYLNQEPECGLDFCDCCGDCLHCDGDYCVVCGNHVLEIGYSDLSAADREKMKAEIRSETGLAV